ncbi:MAG: nitroreductase family protein [Fibromonadaceae bacterium]|nr:nitroreductase family protein [Fibromonadaceae bacterium]
MRKSLRSFTGEIIPADVVQSIVLGASRAPSSKNTQPWKLVLVQGLALESLREDYIAAFKKSEAPAFEYAYSPDPLPEAYKKRAIDLGKAFLIHKGIGREDKEKRKEHDCENFRFFGAMQVFFLAVNKGEYGQGTFLDCGLFLQALMTELDNRGLGSCPQYSVMAYPGLLHKHIPNSENLLFLLALPFGYPKTDSAANTFVSQREPLENYFRVVE